jgi:hypothetical protein
MKRRLSDPKIDLRNNAREPLEAVFEKHLQLQADSGKKTKKVTQDEIDYPTFRKVDMGLNYLKMYGPDYELTEMLLPKRRNNLSDLFFSQLSYDIIDALIEDVVRRYPNGLPAIFYRKEETRHTKDPAQAKRNMLIHYWAIRLWIGTIPKHRQLKDLFPNSRLVIPGYEDWSMSYPVFNSMHIHFTFPCSLVPLLNDQMRRWVKRTPRVVVTDEKQKKCPQDSPLARYAKKIDGHWTTEVAVCGPDSGLPYVMTLIPITSVKEENDVDDLPFNNLSLRDIMEEAFEGVDDISIMLTDCYYSDSSYRHWARANGKLHHCFH